MARKKSNGYGIAAEKLRQFIEQVETLQTEKDNIASMITDVFREARANGFDLKTMRSIIKLRKMDEHTREEYEALLDIYKGALGMLNGTPLGEAAIRRLSEGKKPEQDKKAPEDEEDDSDLKAEKEPEAPQVTTEEAREMARKAAKEGRPVTDNPFPARDPNRAAWDEEWCKSTGTDGMELPEAWKRKPKPKDEEEGDNE